MLALATVAVGLLGTWLGTLVGGRLEADLGPFRVELAASLGRGLTRIELPPFGSLTADTHTAPVSLQAVLQDVHVRTLTSLLGGGLDRVTAVVEQDAIDSLQRLALRTLAAGTIGALLLSLLVFRDDLRRVLRATVAGMLILGTTQAVAIATYDATAFLRPTYSGTLALAPQVIGPVRAATQRIDAFRQQLTRVVDGAVRAYTSVQASPLGAGGEIRVLHISDIHLSPVGMTFARQIAEGFDVDLVLDTGDLTSFGTPAESLILGSVRGFDRPYVFVRGNHDWRTLQVEISALPRTTVLDGGVATVQGLTIYGLGHPVFNADRAQPIEDADFAARATAACDTVRAGVEALDRPPDIVAVHDDRMAGCVAGLVPLVTSGHFHVAGARVESGTIFLRAGTTGGAGPTLFTDEGGQPLSAEVLYFAPATGVEPPRLLAWDVIEQDPETGTLTVVRHLAGDLLVPTPTPTPTQTASPTAG